MEADQCARGPTFWPEQKPEAREQRATGREKRPPSAFSCSTAIADLMRAVHLPRPPIGHPATVKHLANLPTLLLVYDFVPNSTLSPG